MSHIDNFDNLLKPYVPKFLRKYTNFLKFIIVGGIGTFVNLFALWLCKDVFGLSLRIAGIIAIEISIINNFILNHIWTFRARKNKSSIFAKFGKYHVSVLLGLAINYGMLLLLTEVFGIYYLLSNFIGIICATLSNYLLSAKWAWKHSEEN